VTDLQFDTAEPTEPEPASVTCAGCRRPVVEAYYRLGGSRFCTPCRDAIVAGETGGSPAARFFKAFLYGSVGAAVGAVPYFLLLWLANVEIGFLAILVGVLAGMGVRNGCEGRGGWLYQLMAMALTYGAICTTYVPLVIRGMDEAQRSSADASEALPRPVAYCVAVPIAFLFPILAPFVGGASGIMAWIIVGIGLYEAWKINKRVIPPFEGPITPGPAPPAPEPGSGG